ncbi:Hypothetical protein KNT65_gp222 [Escherichia phage EcS1]|uniref:Uncharacterized protein n=1 Tax=Escherichia phage EcS1 TaxID=2083276 RepID=A0A2Z5ZCZ9_9CAUD|nr:Hypothetical protein KNT65_gp222 [Escherichia phage EcS1]BBC78271.1 Hypothetical protein [Escherichia phage EcS1]
MLTSEKIVYKWTEAGKQFMEDRSAGFASAWKRLIGFGEFEVAELDKDGNIIAVRTDKGTFKANEGEFDNVWCMFLQNEISKKFIRVDTEQDFWTITIPTSKSNLPLPNGPFTEQEAKDFAVSQLRNASDGVRVIVVKKTGEAFVSYGVK